VNVLGGLMLCYVYLTIYLHLYAALLVTNQTFLH